jgi:hypothetical protein
MKKLFTLILVLSAWNSFAQLTLVKETDKDNLRPFQLQNGDWMLYSRDYKSLTSDSKLKTIIFYKQDLSVYKSVEIPQVFPFDTSGYTNNNIYLQGVNIYGLNQSKLYLADGFFNSDSKIEFIIGYQSDKSVNSKTYVMQTIIIFNEDGVEVQKFENSLGGISFDYWKHLNVSFSNSSENYKTYNTKIFSIPGNLPCPTSCSQKAASIAPITQPNEFKGIQVTGFPNPSTDKVTLEYALPEGVAFGTLRLYTQTGELVKEFKVSNQVDHLELPVSEYTSGTYYYELQAGGNTSGGKKIVVIH